jgi:parallel beta-helix repeat protein
LEKVVYGTFLILILLISASTLLFSIKPAEGATIIVPDDYTSIQKAINAAASGDTVFVREGIYVEHIVVNKTISLVGENKTLTIIDGNRTGTVFSVTACNVTIRGFTIRNSDCGVSITGLSVPRKPVVLNQGANITDNVLTNDENGISADEYSRNATITRNDFIGGSSAISLQGTFEVETNGSLTWLNTFHSVIGNNFLNVSNGAILVEGAGNSISQNNIMGCGAGITISGPNNSVTGNAISNCSTQGIGAGSYYSTLDYLTGLFGHNYYANNWVSWSSLGLQIVGGGNVLRNNTMFGDGIGFEVGWPGVVPIQQWPTTSVLSFIQDIDTSNTVNGKPIYYIVNKQNMSVPEDAGYVAVVNSTKVDLEGLNMSNDYYGPAGRDVVVYAFTNDSAIQNVSAQGFEIIACNNVTIKNTDASEFDLSGCINVNANGTSEAWMLWKTNGSTITDNYGSITTEYSVDNHFAGNVNASITLMASNGSMIENNHGGSIAIEGDSALSGPNPFLTVASDNNTVANNAVSGISIMSSCNNKICNNSIMCPNPGDAWSYTDGISLESAYNNTIDYNTITGAARGITGGDYSPQSVNNTFLGNIIANGIIGIAECGDDNVFINNTLLNNRYSVGSAWLLDNDVDASNTVNGKIIYFFENQSNFIIDPSTCPNLGYLALANCTNSTISNLTLTNNCEGLMLSNARNVTITDCEMQEDIIGLSITGSSNMIINNTISNNLQGLSLLGVSSVNNAISGNMITNNTYRNFAPQDTSIFAVIGLPYYITESVNWIEGTSGGCLIMGFNNTIDSNSIKNNARGFTLYGGGNTFRNNALDGNIYNIALLDGSWSFGMFAQNMDSSNLVDGKPICYWANQHDREVPEDAGFVLMLNSTNITIKNLNITNDRYGIVLADTSNTTITNTTITSCLIGIYITQSSATVSESAQTSTRNTIANCKLTNDCAGIGVYPGNLTLIQENTISHNQVGIWIGPGSNNNTILENAVTNNTLSSIYRASSLSENVSYPFPEQDSIPPIIEWLDFGSVILESSNNTVAENTIAYNDFGLTVGNPIFGSPGGNVIYHNSFINNTYFQVSVGSQNYWNIGYPGGGNYFSNYNGTDNYSGPNQNETGCDGIGDTPYPLFFHYTFGGGVYRYEGWAYYPLMTPWTPGPTRVFTINVTNALYKVVFNTNSTITNLQLNRTDPTQPELVFNATGTPGATGYLNVTIPKVLLNATDKNSWIILVDGKLANGTITENDTCTFISIIFQYHSPVKIEIRGTSVVPENFAPIPTTLLFLIALISALFARKGRRKPVSPTAKLAQQLQ